MPEPDGTLGPLEFYDGRPCFARPTDRAVWAAGSKGGNKAVHGAPMGRAYLLSNSEINKSLYDDGLLGVKLRPFWTSAKSLIAPRHLGPGTWLGDKGVQGYECSVSDS